MKQDDRASGGLNRRNTLKFAAAAGTVAAGALLGRQAFAQAAGGAETPAADPAISPKWHRIRLGDAKITTILDGARPGEGPYPTFGADQSAEAVAELMRANYLPEDQYVNGFTPVLVEIGENLVLFDTGMGPSGRANGMGLLTERMRQAGYSPEDVDVVVLTHFHGDHIGGLMENGEPVFANARYVAGQVEYDWWTSQEARSGERASGAALVAEKVVPLRDKMTLIGEGDEVVPGITAMEAFGHSPGHMIFEVESGGQRLWLTADTANHFVASLQRPEWEVRFDMDKEMAAATRKRVFDQVAEQRIPFIGYHMPFPSIGYAAKEGEGYRFIPETYQLDVTS